VSELIDNRAHRIRTLKEIITRLHRGEAPQAVRPQLVALVRECDAGEIAAMEQELMADGMQVSEIMRMCDLHADALRDIIVDRTPRDVPAGHPVDTFRRENRALGDTAARLRAAIGLLTLGRRDDDRDRDDSHCLRGNPEYQWIGVSSGWAHAAQRRYGKLE